MERTFNTLDFEHFDAVAAGEKWAVEYRQPRCPAVRILIDGRDLNEMIVEAEARFKGEPPRNPDDEYGHESARSLLKGLKPSEGREDEKDFGGPGKSGTARSSQDLFDCRRLSLFAASRSEGAVRKLQSGLAAGLRLVR